MKRFLSNALTGVLTVCALLMTALVVRREFFPPTPRAEKPRPVKEWAAIAAVGARMGPADARVRIVEFSDFQCPFCERVQLALRTVRDRNPKDVSVTFRHLPLESIHPHAFASAMAVECAGVQGRFEAYHDVLFRNQRMIGVTPFEAFADSAGVADRAAFARCVSQGRFQRRVEEDVRAARQAGLGSTPSIIVNGTLLPGTPSAGELERYVAGLLNKPAPVAATAVATP